MRIIRTREEVTEYVAAHGGGILVPTMGALHEGHASLIRLGVETAKHLGQQASGPLPHCVVSIFVNPTQFDDPKDFTRYPRVLDADLAMCEAAGADAVFAPGVETMYPPGEEVPVPPLPDVATKPGLEDAHRPGHFRGVCQVVLRLFTLLRPAAAIFGEKDWQQLQVIRAMTQEQGLPIQIIAGATMRETDGLAMSSRNVFLSSEERRCAAAIPLALREASSHTTPAEAEEAMIRTLRNGGLRVEYAVVRDAETLLPLPEATARRVLIAARLGDVRLIDNQAWP